MLEKIKQVPDEIFNFLVKIVMVSFLAISIKLAVEMKKGGVKMINVFLSIVIGVGMAVIFGNAILHYFSPYWVPFAVAVVTVLGEKMASWLIFKFKVDEFLETFFKDFLKYLTRKK